MYFANKALNYRKFLSGTVAALGLAFMAASAQAQVSFDISDENAQPGDTVTVTWTYTSDGNASAIEGRFDFDATNIDNVDYTNCTSSWTAASHFTQCLDQGSTGDNVFFQILDTGGAPLPSGTGTIDFTLAPATPAPSTINLIWDDTAFVVDGAPTVTATDGSISVTAGPQSELVLTPNPLDFGTVDLGNMPVTDSFTLENAGAADATVSGVSLTGADAEFTIASENCSGTLAAGATCSIDIQFNAGANGAYTNVVSVTSDADINPNPTADIQGSADSVANLSITPAFGPVDLGTGVIGTTVSANGSVSNSGSADGDFGCSLTGDPEISTSPDLTGPITVPAGGSTDFSIACAIPETATEGDVFTATLSCSGDNGFSGTHDISCTATEFVPFPIPTMSKWGLTVLALLMVMVGGLTVRFFRT